MAPDRNNGIRREVRGCDHCGFAYLFELLDDYYPAPNAAFFATEKAIGQRIRDALNLSFSDGTDYVSTALEWEVRVAGKRVELQAGPERATAVADIFPAYDDEEGGVLIVLTPGHGN